MDDASTITYLHRSESPSSGSGSQHLSDAKEIYLVRSELAQILNVYGRMVAAGQWKDYNITPEKHHATFAIFRRAAEQPLYRIIKQPALAAKQGAWRIEGVNGQILKRGHELDAVLRYFNRLMMKAI